jgi:transcriptional regulator with XRE-family HTH domain
VATNRLKELREARGLSLAALAALVGTSNQEISHLELGKRQLTVDWLERIASALGCHPWAIVSESAPSDPREVELVLAFRAMDHREQETLLATCPAPRRH